MTFLELHSVQKANPSFSYLNSKLSDVKSARKLYVPNWVLLRAQQTFFLTIKIFFGENSEHHAILLFWLRKPLMVFQGYIQSSTYRKWRLDSILMELSRDSHVLLLASHLRLQLVHVKAINRVFDSSSKKKKKKNLYH